MYKGFTIIEMLIAVAIFVVVITISLTSFLNITDVQRKAEAFRSINDNLNFSLETMAREIRTSTNYNVGTDGTSITVNNAYNENVTYRLNNKRVERSSDGINFLAMTAPEIIVTKLLFIKSDLRQPRITIIINGSSGTAKTKSYLNLQTTVSQRKRE